MTDLGLAVQAVALAPVLQVLRPCFDGGLESEVEASRQLGHRKRLDEGLVHVRHIGHPPAGQQLASYMQGTIVWL